MEGKQFTKSNWFLKNGIKKMLHFGKNRKKKITVPVIYFGTWMFTDEVSKRSHRLEIAENLDIFIDSKHLPGKIVTLNDQELLFLDNYGYHLRIDTIDREPASVYDEADDRVYPLEKLT